MSTAAPQKPAADAVVQPVRNAVRALIVQRNQVLLLRKRGANGAECYALPGGGQDSGELLHEALQRECIEEIDSGVEILRLAHVANAFTPRAASPLTFRQNVEFLFHCRLPSDYTPRMGRRPDKSQVAVEWVGLQLLDRIDLRPRGMAALIRQAALDEGPVYAGTL